MFEKFVAAMRQAWVKAQAEGILFTTPRGRTGASRAKNAWRSHFFSEKFARPVPVTPPVQVAGGGSTSERCRITCNFHRR